MALVKISALPVSTGVVLTTDYIPMVHNTVTEKVTPQILLNAAQMTNAIAVVGTSTVAQSVSAATLKAAVLQWTSPLTELTTAIALVGSSTTPQSVSAATLKAASLQWNGVKPQNLLVASYTLVLADAGKHLLHTGDATARTWTIPANASVAFPIGTSVTFVNDTGAGVITIAITTDSMILSSAGTTGSRTLAANGIATALKISATKWIISGYGLT